MNLLKNLASPMKLKYKLHRFGLMKRMHRGCRLMIFPSFRCPVQCSYCTLRFASDIINGKMITTPKEDELSLEEWKQIIRSYPKKVREVQVSGGEPLVWRDYSAFVNWCLDEGYFVTVFSSLWNQKGLNVRESVRLRIGATYHRNMPKELFEYHLKLYRAKYRVNVEEVETDAVVSSYTKPMESQEYSSTCAGLMWGPDGKLFFDFWDLCDHYARQNKRDMRDRTKEMIV